MGNYCAGNASVYKRAAIEVDELVRAKGCGPILVRLAWHDSGNFCEASKTGGPNGCIRFGPEASHGANNGLDIARELLQPILQKYPDIGVADFYTLASCVAIKSMGGPTVQWRSGRVDGAESAVGPDGRLPDATQGCSHLREVFGRMGLSDQDIVALSGAHTIGHCHKDRSGFEGPWTEEPLKFDNSYFKLLLNETWTKKPCKNQGQNQYEDSSKKLMMLPTDMALLKDDAFKALVEKYAEDEKAFFADFAVAYQRLIELGTENLSTPVVY